ncbi:MAG: hypothetical protein IPP78_14590 [Holophagaceae bacterium]|nr:hypothetical protein [Holophagaceae bacterium]
MRPMIWLFLFFAFTGCAPMVVDLSSSNHLVDRQPTKQGGFDYKLVVLDRATEMKMDQKIFGASTFPMRTAEKPRETLEKDIARFFDRLTSRMDDGRRIVARIDRADAYWVNPGTNTIPIVGMFTVWASNYPFTFDISVTFEVEENSKVVHSYSFNQKIEILDGNGATGSGIEKSYQRLISNYRKMMFDALEVEFIPRYLSKPEPVHTPSSN